jgi:hypothetical protein
MVTIREQDFKTCLALELVGFVTRTLRSGNDGAGRDQTPEPVSDTVAAGPPAAPVTRLRVAVFAPLEMGANRTDVVQAAPTASGVVVAHGGLSVLAGVTTVN